MRTIFFLTLLLGVVSANGQTLSESIRGNKFNPDIGLNALTLFKNSSRTTHNDGVSLQEVELQFSSDVDAYFRAEALIGIHQQSNHGHHHGHHHSHGFDIEPEEVFVETLSIPYMTMKFGKFYADFGKYNAVHSHALPFIYRSQVQTFMFGDEGLAESGVSSSLLVPASWFSELSLQILQPTNHDVFAHSHHSVAYLAKWKNLWDLNSSTTFELGLSGLQFSDESSGKKNETQMFGTDFTFKWLPLKESKSSAFIWSTEFIQKERKGKKGQKNGGMTSFIRYQLVERWYSQIQYEFLGFGKTGDVKDLNSYTALIAFVPTEFSSIRAQYDSIHDGKKGGQPERRISLQLNISIGAHPAHTY